MKKILHVYGMHRLFYRSSRQYSLLPALFLIQLLILGINSSTYAQSEQEVPTTVLSSEAPSLRFEHLGVENGLAQGSANTIMQDSQGFLWIATQGGLHRFDGQKFKVYTSTPFDTTSLSESWVWSAAEAKNGDLWVTTQGGGLNHMDRSTETFTHYLHDPSDSSSLSSNNTFYALEDHNGDLWVSTFDGGLNRLRADNDGQFIHYRHDPDDPNSLTDDGLYWLDEDGRGMIWAGSNNGLNRINPQTGKVTRFLYDSDGSRGYGAPQNVLGQYLPPDEPDVLWLATGNGLVRLNSKTGKHERFLIEPNKNGSVNPLNFIHQVVADPTDPDILWVGGPGTGIARFDMRTEKFTSYRHDPRDPHSLSENYVQSLFADRSGMIWAGTASEGLNAFNPGAVNFANIRNDPGNPKSLAPGIVWGVYEDQKGILWIGSDIGAGGNYLTRLDAASGTVNRYCNNPQNTVSLLPGNMRTFAEDSDGHFWIGSSGGLNLFNRANGHVKRFRQEQTEENRGRNSIFALAPTHADSNILWSGSAGGLDRFDTKTGKFTHILLKTGNLEHEPGVLSLHEDAGGNLWAGTSEGLFRIEPSRKIVLASAYNPHDTTTISQNNIISIAERPREPGVLWLATQNGGLDRFDTHTGTATHLTTEKGLPSNAIYAVLVDSSGTLWMSTNNGISNYDPETATIRNYGLDDGLMALEYNQNAYAKGAGGVLYFGSGKGVTAFIPEQLHINEVPPQVVLSGFRLFNKPVVAGPHSPLKKPINNTDEIKLKYNQNEMTFDFVALHYANPSKNTYAYQLKGFDKNWIDAGSQHSATYTNLPAGEYTFHVKAANPDGVWNTKDASVKLLILPPWYHTWWAYGLFIGIIGMTIFGVDRVQRRRLLKKEHERTALREAELRAEAENKRRADTEQLSKIGRTITSTLSVNKIIDTVYENVNALMDAAIFGVGIYNKERNCLDFPATKENGKMLPAYVNRLDEENRLAVWCFKNREEIIIGDLPQEYSHYINTHEAPVQGKDAISIIYLPLVHQDHVIGVITTQSFKEDAYSPYHVNLLRNLATYAAIALDNAAAYRKLNSTLSELKATQQQLVQQEKLASLGQLTAGIAHEIKNPLNFVNNFSDVSVELIEEVREELAGAGPRASHVLATLDDIEANLRKINEHGARADSIVKSMLQHSRGGSGKKEPTDLNTLIKEYVNLAFHGMRASKNPINVDIQLDLDEKAGDVSIVGEDFSRVILNLCTNAFDAMREKLRVAESRQLSANGDKNYEPKLSIRTLRNGSKITIEIKDNGPGIPENIRQKIFEPFFTTKPAGEGTGLGLSMTYDIISYHNGTLQVRTEAGAFTEFIVTLPES